MVTPSPSAATVTNGWQGLVEPWFNIPATDEIVCAKSPQQWPRPVMPEDNETWQ